MIKQGIKAGGIGLILALLAQPAMAQASSSQHGVIRIVGQIVETPCDVQPQSQQIAIRCYRNGTWIPSTIAASRTTQGELPGNMGTVATRYTNPQRTRAVTTVTYY